MMNNNAMLGVSMELHANSKLQDNKKVPWYGPKGAKPNYHVDEKNQEDIYNGFQSKDPIVAIPGLQEKSMAHRPSHGSHIIGAEHPTSYLETMMHLFKGNVGSGLFAMGDAFRNAGIIAAPIVTLILSIISVHCQHVLVSTAKEMMRRTGVDTAPDFAETVELCFSTGPPKLRGLSVLMRRLVNTFLCITQLGFCCIYFVFISDNLKQVMDYYGYVLNVHYYMAILLLPIWLSCLIRNLKYLAILSAIANVFMISGIAITLYFTCQDLPSISTRDYVAYWEQWPLFFGTAIFAFEGIGLVLPLRNEMKQPYKFDLPFGVLNIGMTIVTTLLITVGFLGYLKHGDEIKGSLTLNLPETNIMAQCVKIIISTGVLLGYPLQFYIPMDIMWPSIAEIVGPFKWPVFAELSFRSLMVLATFVLAEAIPYLNLFISLVGAVSSSALALIFPPILQLVLNGQSAETSYWIILKNTLIIAIGVLGFATGTYESLRSIVKAFKHNNNN